MFLPSLANFSAIFECTILSPAPCWLDFPPHKIWTKSDIACEYGRGLMFYLWLLVIFGRIFAPFRHWSFLAADQQSTKMIWSSAGHYFAGQAPTKGLMLLAIIGDEGRLTMIKALNHRVLLSSQIYIVIWGRFAHKMLQLSSAVHITNWDTCCS